jgi:hypothetical protein
LTEALKRVLEDEGLSQNLAREGRDWVNQERTWDRTTSVYGGFYNRALLNFR